MSLQKQDSQPRKRVDPPKSAMLRQSKTKRPVVVPVPKPSIRKSIKHGPVSIDINANDTGVESAEEAPPRKKAKIAPVTLHHGSQYQQEDNDESESSSGNDSNDPALDSDASMDNPQDDLGAGQHLEEESTVFTNGMEEEGNTERSRSNASYDNDSIFFEEGQLSDMEIDGEPELMEPTPSRRSLYPHGSSGKQWLVVSKAMASQRSQKLEFELPRVSEMVLPTSQAVQGPRTTTSTFVSDSKSELKWKECTKINTISHKCTFTLGPLSGQPAVMLSVIEKAIWLHLQAWWHFCSSFVIIHACIQDFSSGIKDNFPTKELDGVWKLSLEILDRIQKRNHMKYHRLMHNLYIESFGAVSSMHSMTNQQVYDTIDWSAIEQNDNDYNGNGNHDGNLPAQASNKVNKQPVTAADTTNEGSRIGSML
ncbi:hypothetical protein EV368DRAFT_62376 [Lentinula lateritia]|nr:hypothetical protein EV368DRAFT_62376 [Lentinula lateritia]